MFLHQCERKDCPILVILSDASLSFITLLSGARVLRRSMRVFVPRSHQAGLNIIRPPLCQFRPQPARQRWLSCARSPPLPTLKTLHPQSARPWASNWNPILPSSQQRHCSYRSMCRSMADISGSIDITKNREVLPTNVVPRHYDLTLEPNFEKFTFEGTGQLKAGVVLLLEPFELTSMQWSSTSMLSKIRPPLL